MRRVGQRWLSLRWTALESGATRPAPSIGPRARATAASGSRRWPPYRRPPQNMLVADRAGTIAIRSTGRFPIRAGDGRGDRVHDGTTRASDWSGDWPLAE